MTLVRSNKEGSATVSLYSQVPKTEDVEPGDVVLALQETNPIQSKDDKYGSAIEGNNAAEEGMVFVQKVELPNCLAPQSDECLCWICDSHLTW